jgi:DNA-directed RNA polymerase specialized sigma24 family protein
MEPVPSVEQHSRGVHVLLARGETAAVGALVRVRQAQPLFTLEQLAGAVCAGDRRAWMSLQHAILPRIAAILRAHRGMRSRGLHLQIDDLQEVTTTTLERLSRDDFRNLRRYVAQLERPTQSVQSFESWLFGAIDFTVRDHLRRRYGRAPKAERELALGRPPSKRDLNTNAEGLCEQHGQKARAHTLSMTKDLTAAQIFAYASARFAAPELLALRMHYVQDCDFGEIAQALQLSSAKDAERLIRRLNARLRHRFDVSETEDRPRSA